MNDRDKVRAIVGLHWEKPAGYLYATFEDVAIACYRAGLEEAIHELLNICCVETQCEIGTHVVERLRARIGNEVNDGE